MQNASRENLPTHASDWLWYLIDSVTSRCCIACSVDRQTAFRWNPVASRVVRTWCYRFWTTWGWVINERIKIFGWTNPLTSMETHHTKDSWWWKRLYFTPRKSVQELFTESLYGEQHSSTALLRKPLLEVRMVTKPMAAVLVTSCKDVNPALLNQSPFLSQVPVKSQNTHSGSHLQIEYEKFRYLF